MLSVIVYGVCLSLPIAVLAPYTITRRRPPWGLLLFIYCPTFLFAALRGDSGTDTPNYRYLFEFVELDTFFVWGVDPLFQALVGLIKGLGLGAQWFLAAQAFLCWVIYTFAAARLDRSGALFSIVLLPVLMIDATFNGLRYGLAFAICAVVLTYSIGDSRGLKGLFVRLSPSLAHSSLLVLLFRSPVFAAIVVAVLAILGVTNSDVLSDARSFILWKLGEYSDFERPQWYSGIFPLIQLVALLLIYPWWSRANQANHDPDWLRNLALGVATIGVAVTPFSYAGLRFLTIAVFLFCIATARSKGVTRSSLGSVVIVLAISGITAMNFVRQIFFPADTSMVTFVPYEFFF